MRSALLRLLAVPLWITWSTASVAAAEPLAVVADFEGASVSGVEIDQLTRTIRFMPGGDPLRGWPCWWYFRIDGVTPGETLTLRLRSSTATAPQAESPLRKPLASSWAMPTQATISSDGQAWRHTSRGERLGEWMSYVITPDSQSVWVAWGPPYTPSAATEFVRLAAEEHPFATARELCRSRGDRPVPLLHIQEGDLKSDERFGVWVQARQHAWESGSSWVAQGFVEWLLREAPDAAWLRQHAEIFVVPIMDIDNTATGNGGKDALPHDHNRDWSARPHWNETVAAQRQVSELIDEQRMDLFLDLHNPAPGDPTFFYVLPADLIAPETVSLRDRFIDLAYGQISSIKPQIPMSNKPKVTGASYHPLWRQISANWVSMNGNPQTVSLCLETIWNCENSTTAGYRAVGASLAAATREFLSERHQRR